MHGASVFRGLVSSTAWRLHRSRNCIRPPPTSLSPLPSEHPGSRRPRRQRRPAAAAAGGGRSRLLPPRQHRLAQAGRAARCGEATHPAYGGCSTQGRKDTVDAVHTMHQKAPSAGCISQSQPLTHTPKHPHLNRLFTRFSSVSTTSCRQLSPTTAACTPLACRQREAQGREGRGRLASLPGLGLNSPSPLSHTHNTRPHATPRTHAHLQRVQQVIQQRLLGPARGKQVKVVKHKHDAAVAAAEGGRAGGSGGREAWGEGGRPVRRTSGRVEEQQGAQGGGGGGEGAGNAAWRWRRPPARPHPHRPDTTHPHTHPPTPPPGQRLEHAPQEVDVVAQRGRLAELVAPAPEYECGGRGGGGGGWGVGVGG